MFTGIVEEVGTVVAIDPLEAGAKMVIGCSSVLIDSTPGASIAVNGTCLTAVEVAVDHFAATLSPETLSRTNLGELKPGSLVNLERPLRFNGRLEGHFVLGHVDATGEVVSLDALGSDNWDLTVRLPSSLSRYVVDKASIAIDGISLTVARVEGDVVRFAIIPHTFHHTNLRQRRAGDRVNLEADILAKHIEKLLASSPKHDSRR